MHGRRVGNIHEIKVGACPRRLNIEITIVQDCLWQPGNIVSDILDIRNWRFGNVEMKKPPIVNVKNPFIGNEINIKKPSHKGDKYESQ